MNNALTLTDALWIGGGSIAFLTLTLFAASKVWRLAPNEYLAWLQGQRPRNWRRWPVSGRIWRSIDARPSRALWLARVLSILAIAMGLSGVVLGVVIAFRVLP